MSLFRFYQTQLYQQLMQFSKTQGLAELLNGVVVVNDQ
jgi:hypothetical protein